MTARGATVARQLAARRFEHPLVSAFIDLDPTRFASSGARATEVNSLLDQAQQELHAKPLQHEDRMALEQDLRRIGRYVTSEFEVSGTQGLAIYCCSREALFEPVRLPHQVASDIVIEPLPRLEPLLPAREPACVCIALVNRREARFFVSRTDSAAGDHRIEDRVHDGVHGQHRQGGWSDANYERSIEADVDAHLRRAAERLYRLWERERFQRLVLGGPHEVVTRFAQELHPDLRGVLDDAELAIDVNTSSPNDVHDALAPLRQRWRELTQWQALQQLLSTMDIRPGTAVGLPHTLEALGRRQVRSLVLAARVDAPGCECPQCGELYVESNSHCEADGAELKPLSSLRSAMIRAAVLQDAEVIVLADFDDRPEIGAFEGVGAILRY